MHVNPKSHLIQMSHLVKMPHHMEIPQPVLWKLLWHGKLWHFTHEISRVASYIEMKL